MGSASDLIDVVLDMRGTNPATVKDVEWQLRTMKALVVESTNTVIKTFRDEFAILELGANHMDEQPFRSIDSNIFRRASSNISIDEGSHAPPGRVGFNRVDSYCEA